jgi:hypothetical protein
MLVKTHVQFSDTKTLQPSHRHLSSAARIRTHSSDFEMAHKTEWVENLATMTNYNVIEWKFLTTQSTVTKLHIRKSMLVGHIWIAHRMWMH